MQYSSTWNAGVIKIENGIISYSSSGYGGWDIALDEISIIGEYTNEDGPALADYFFVFAALSTDQIYEVPTEAAGFDTVLVQLRTYFDGMECFVLNNSATYKSHVSWPIKYIGREFYKYSRVSDGKSWLDKLVDSLLGRNYVISKFNEELKD